MAPLTLGGPQNTGGKKLKEKQMKVHYLVDEEWAQYTVEIMNKHFDIGAEKTVIFETNAGPGILSLFLLKNGAKQIFGWETDANYLSALEHLQDRYLGNFYCVKGNLYRSKDWWIQPAAWDEECRVRVVGYMPSMQMSSLLYLWVNCLTVGSGIFAHGRVEQYLLVNGMEKSLIEEGHNALAEDRKLNLPGNIRPTRAVIYPLLFDIDVIMQIPVECFNPPKVKDGWKHLDWDRQNQYMIKLVPKLDLFDRFPRERLPEFISLVRQLMVRRCERLVIVFESWIPGFGVWLLEHGYDMMNQTSDLKLKDYEHLFMAILAHPTYKLPEFIRSSRDIFKTENKTKSPPAPPDNSLETDPSQN